MKLPGLAYREGSEFDNGLRAYLDRSDEPADAVAAEFARLPPGAGAKLLERALKDGIDTVPDAPASLVRLFAELDLVPWWVDRTELEYGAETFMRIGSFGAAALMCHSLPTGYLDSASSKPLVFSGRLMTRAPRRLLETAKFVYECCLPRGLDRSGAGFGISVRVRLMHAQVRRLLLRSGKWDSAAWGSPISQYHMLGTNALFSFAVLDAVRRWGVYVSAREERAVYALWRYNGYLMGIDPAILPTNAFECRRLLDAIERMRPPADEVSVDLTRALLEAGATMAGGLAPWLSGRVTFSILSGFTRDLLGRRRADELGLPRTPWRFLPLALRPLVRFVEMMRLFLPGTRRLAVRLGRGLWRVVLEAGLGGRDAGFAMPAKLDGSGATARKGVRR